MLMTNEERDRLIEAAEELKLQRTRETHRRVVFLAQGKEWASGRTMRDRYFVVNVPLAVLESVGDAVENANLYVNHQRFPLFYEMMLSGRYLPLQACHFLSDGRDEVEEIT